MNTSIVILAVVAVLFVLTLPAILRGIEAATHSSDAQAVPDTSRPANLVAQDTGTHQHLLAAPAHAPPAIHLQRPAPQLTVIAGGAEEQAAEAAEPIVLPIAVGQTTAAVFAAGTTDHPHTSDRKSREPVMSTSSRTDRRPHQPAAHGKPSRAEAAVRRAAGTPAGKAPAAQAPAAKAPAAQTLAAEVPATEVPGASRQTKQVLGVLFMVAGCAALVTFIISLVGSLTWAVPVLLAALSLGSLTVVIALNSFSAEADTQDAPARAAVPARRTQTAAKQVRNAAPVQAAQERRAAKQEPTAKKAPAADKTPVAKKAATAEKKKASAASQHRAASQNRAEKKPAVRALRERIEVDADETLTNEIPVIKETAKQPASAATEQNAAKQDTAAQREAAMAAVAQAAPRAEEEAEPELDALDRATLSQGLVKKTGAGVELHLGSGSARGLEKKKEWTPREVPAPTYVKAAQAPQQESAPLTVEQTSYGSQPESREELAAKFAAELGAREEFADAARAQDADNEKAKRHGRAAIRSDRSLAQPEAKVVVDDVLARRRA